MKKAGVILDAPTADALLFAVGAHRLQKKPHYQAVSGSGYQHIAG
jgi:hypothetical protein